jgi:hypothetical protein
MHGLIIYSHYPKKCHRNCRLYQGYEVGANRTAEEHRRGEHFMDKIAKYANSLNEEDRKLFYRDLRERWNRVLREESKRLSKLWK